MCPNVSAPGCKVCHMKFVQSPRLLTYMLVHKVDTSNQLDTAEDCKQSDTPCDDQTHVDSGKHTCEVCAKKFTCSRDLKYVTC